MGIFDWIKAFFPASRAEIVSIRGEVAVLGRQMQELQAYAKERWTVQRAQEGKANRDTMRVKTENEWQGFLQTAMVQLGGAKSKEEKIAMLVKVFAENPGMIELAQEKIASGEIKGGLILQLLGGFLQKEPASSGNNEQGPQAPTGPTDDGSGMVLH